MLHGQRAIKAGKIRRSEVDVTAEAVAGLGAGFASLPSWTLDENQLADLEMLLSGVFAPSPATASAVTSTSDRSIARFDGPLPVQHQSARPCLRVLWRGLWKHPGRRLVGPAPAPRSALTPRSPSAVVQPACKIVI